MSQRLLEQIKKCNAETFGYNADHHEVREGEIWITNAFKDSDLASVTWRTARVGDTAYTTKGVRLPTGKPVFVQESEILNAPD